MVFKRLVNRTASSWLTISTGRLSPLKALGLSPMTASHWAWVTVDCPM